MAGPTRAGMRESRRGKITLTAKPSRGSATNAETSGGPSQKASDALTDALARIEGSERDITGLVALCEAARLKVRVALDE